jgi:hypothetical protein
MTDSAQARMRILNMVSAGKISAEEGVRLLESLSQPEQPEVKPPTAPNRFERSTLVFRVIESATGDVLVNLKLPLSLVSTAQKLGARIAHDIEGIDLNKILEDLRSGKIEKAFRIQKQDEIIEIDVE